MAAPDFIAGMSALHAQARAGTLSPAERRAYVAQRQKLMKILLDRQSLAPGQIARRAFRVARALPVKIFSAGTPESSVTVEISSTGFSALLAKAPGAVGECVTFDLLLPGGYFVSGEAGIMHLHEQQGSFRIGGLILKPTPEDREQLEQTVFDEVLANFKLPL